MAQPDSAPSTPESQELQTLGFWPTFIYYFASTTLIGTLASGQALHLGLSEGPTPLLLGLPLGLLAGFVGAYYNRTTTLEIPFGSLKVYQPQLEQTLKNLGFEKVDLPKESAIDGYEVYQRKGLRHWFSGSVLVGWRDKQVCLFSRARITRQLKYLLQSTAKS